MSSVQNLIIRVACAVIVLSFACVTAQTKKRLIPFPDWSAAETNDEVALELVEIKIAGNPIRLDQPFDADDNWLKEMTLRVKNVGTKTITTLDIGGGLLHSVDEELPSSSSYQYAVRWHWTTGLKLDKENPPDREIRPGETIELTYAHVNSIYRRTLAKEGEGSFRKLKFTRPGIQYADGTLPFSPPMRFRKTR
jgi:hypothetical protein